MMDKYILHLTLAFLVGGTAGFLLSQKMLEEKYALRAEEEHELFKKVWMEKHPHDLNPVKPAHEEVETLSTINKVLGYSSLGETAQRVERMKRDYTKIGGPIVAPASQAAPIGTYSTKGNEVEYEENPDVVLEKIMGDMQAQQEYLQPLNRNVKPYVISESEFEEGNPHHDKVSITYYAGDDTLADEMNEIMEDIDSTVGMSNLDMDNTDITHPHTIYVRNDRLGIDYDISIDLGEYTRKVLGIEPYQKPLSPKEKFDRAMREKEEAENE